MQKNKQGEPLVEPTQLKLFLEKLKPFTRIPCTRLAIGQGIYYLVSGLWPIFRIDLFVALTGPKTDLWLVKTVALLLVVIGAVLITAGLRRNISFEIFMLAVSSAAALTIVEFVYTFKGVISLIYLLDTAVEIPLVALWILNRSSSHSSRRRAP